MSENFKIHDPGGIYFITSTIVGWIDVFTRIEYKDFLVQSFKYCQKEKGLIIYAWCLMTNHFHLIGGTRGILKLDNIIRDFKKYTSVHLCRMIEGNYHESRKNWMLDMFRETALNSDKHQKYQFWQRSYHPVELSTNEMIDQRLDYLHNNPVKAGYVFSPEQYVYSSAVDYMTNRKGLLDVVIID